MLLPPEEIKHSKNLIYEDLMQKEVKKKNNLYNACNNEIKIISLSVHP